MTFGVDFMMTFQDNVLVVLILEYMMSALERKEKEIQQIKENRFFFGYRDEDYFKLMKLKIELECMRDNFKVIRNFIEIYTRS